MSSYQIPSLCILRAFSSATQESVAGTFSALFGENVIKEVVMVERTDRETSEMFWLIFIHFNKLDESAYGDYLDTVKGFGERVLTGEEIKIEYSSPWYWKVRKYTPKPTAKPRILPAATKTHGAAAPNRAHNGQVGEVVDGSWVSEETTHSGEVAEPQAN